MRTADVNVEREREPNKHRTVQENRAIRRENNKILKARKFLMGK